MGWCLLVAFASSTPAEELTSAIVVGAEQGEAFAWRWIETHWKCQEDPQPRILSAAIRQRRTAFLAKLPAGGQCRLGLNKSIWRSLIRQRDPALARAVLRLVEYPTKKRELLELLVQHGVFEALGLDDEEALFLGFHQGKPALRRELLNQGWGIDLFRTLAARGSAEDMAALTDHSFDLYRLRGSILEAIEEGNVDVLRFLLRLGTREENLFSTAYREKQLAVIPVLIELGLKPSPSELREIAERDPSGDTVAALADAIPVTQVAAAWLAINPDRSLDFLEGKIDRELHRLGLAPQGSLGLRLLALGMDPAFYDAQRRGNTFNAFAVDGTGQDGLTAALRRNDAVLTAVYLKALPARPNPRPDGRTWLHDAASAGDYYTLAALRREGFADEVDASGRRPTDEFWSLSAKPENLRKASFFVPVLSSNPSFFSCNLKSDAPVLGCSQSGFKSTDRPRDRGRVPFSLKVSFPRKLYRVVLQFFEDFGLPICYTKIDSPEISYQGDQAVVVVAAGKGPFSVEIEAKGPRNLQPEVVALAEMAVLGLSSPSSEPWMRWLGRCGWLVLLGFLWRRFAPSSLPFTQKERPAARPIPKPIRAPAVGSIPRPATPLGVSPLAGPVIDPAPAATRTEEPAELLESELADLAKTRLWVSLFAVACWLSLLQNVGGALKEYLSPKAQYLEANLWAQLILAPILGTLLVLYPTFQITFFARKLREVKGAGNLARLRSALQHQRRYWRYFWTLLFLALVAAGAAVVITVTTVYLGKKFG